MWPSFGGCWMVLINILVLVISTNHVTHAHLAIPKRPLGFVYKPFSHDSSGKQPVTLSFYIDITCVDSKVVYPTVIKVADFFGPQKVRLVTHLFSLPYHRNSHTIAKGAHVVDAFTKGNATYDWFKIIYDNLDKLTTSATANLNDEEVIDILFPLAQQVSGISKGQFTQQIENSSVDWDARLGFKYGCTRGVYETPTFMINDVVEPANLSRTFEQWKQLIQSLLNYPELK